MKICVLGAGVIGVTTAYWLARAGHVVTLIDKNSGPAGGASKANGAQLSYSYVEPLPSPATLTKIPNYFLGMDPGVKFGLTASPHYWAWALKFLSNCRKPKFESNFETRLGLARRSREIIAKIEAELPKGALKRTGYGKLVLVDSHQAWESLQLSKNEKARFGFNSEILNREQCFELVPALKHRKESFFGGVYNPDDEALDTQTYCRALLQVNGKNSGPYAIYGEDFKEIEIDNNRIKAVVTQNNRYDCDAVIACLGGDTNHVLGRYIRAIPVHPVQGYSLTMPATKDTPVCSITDMTHKFVVASLGDKVRIAGFMDANLSEKRSKARAQELLEISRRMWPTIADYSAPEYWTGQRPMTPSGTPVIGESKTRGLYINAGHGSLGYTLAAGSAAEILDLVGPAT